jgi:signal transduction histidine kinase
MIQISDELLNKHLLDKARRSHRIMIWCAIFIYPSFGLLDYLSVANWRDFLIVRFSIVLLLILLLLYDNYAKLKPEILAHIPTQLVINSLMWMLSQVHDANAFSIYAINSSTGYIASALFLFWKPINSVLLLTLNISFFTISITLFSPLPWVEVLANGSFLLFTIGLMSQFYIYYRCKIVLSDFRVQQQLSNLNTELWNKHHQIEKQSTEIIKKNTDLIRLNSLKDRLFIIISHDLRAPLQSLKGVLELINKSANISPDEFRFLTRGIKVKVDVTYNLMENLLYWTRSQMEGFNVKPISINIREITNDCTSLLDSIAEKKRVQILNQSNPEHFIKSDLDMIRLVLRNLIMNAIKFSFEEGRIIIKSQVNSNNEIVVSVIDQGTGMTEEEANLLFNNKRSKSKVGTSQEEGTGLGLMLCKEFIEMNNGRIWVVTEPGRGSEFNFAFKTSQTINNAVGSESYMKEAG